MQQVATFTYVTHEGASDTGTVVQNRDGTFSPDTNRSGTGKDYHCAEHGVADFLRRCGGTLTTYQ